MVATWRDSWFEEGMRVFYLTPRSVVDSVLPFISRPRRKPLPACSWPGSSCCPSI